MSFRQWKFGIPATLIGLKNRLPVGSTDAFVSMYQDEINLTIRMKILHFSIQAIDNLRYYLTLWIIIDSLKGIMWIRRTFVIDNLLPILILN